MTMIMDYLPIMNTVMTTVSLQLLTDRLGIVSLLIAERNSEKVVTSTPASDHRRQQSSS
jgi:hypothetical protein